MNKSRNFLVAIGLILSLAACSSPAPTPTGDTTAPTVSLATSSSNVTTAGSITLTATASDNVGVTKVEFYDGSTKLGEDTTAPYTQTVSYTAANNGSKSYTAKAYDAANNTQTSNAVAVTVAITVDTAKPTLLSTIAKSNTSVELVFSEAILGGNNKANFQIFGPTNLTVSAASVAADGKTVTLTTSPQTLNDAYVVNISNITDLAGNPFDLAGSPGFPGSFSGVGP